MSNEILLYQSNELTERIEVRLENETVWLSQQQMATLFQQTKQNISLHINNCFREKELDKNSTVKKYLTVQKEGNRNVKRMIDYYNLDVIISVGYRVKSKQGTKFRIWATNVLKDYLLKGYALNQRMNRVENTVEKLAEKVDEISFQIKTSELPTQGVFFDGQVFDAYELASRIIRSAKNNIVLIDNYIDETTLTHLAKKNKNVKILLLTKNISKQLQLDVQKANAQYGNFEIKKFTQSHDRFIIIDNTEMYHLGASLKDLGKKWFAFTKMNKNYVQNIINAIAENHKIINHD
ncbi:MAG TPA: RhuM family protein [Bacteroidales bacterium]|nr:RhuM family protein [Bacteroidales bacterium]HOR60140.1 RhuM family protein [Bacteroidales bacterium]